MAAKTVGELIKEARAGAKMTQEALGKAVDLSASDIGKAERGQKELSQAQLKAIAKATGVTQKSLLDAAKSGTAAAEKKTGTTAKTSTAAKKTSTSTAKKTSGTASKKADELTLTAAEKKLVELYRAADSDTRKAAVALLKGEKPDNGLLGSLFDMLGESDLLGGVLNNLKK